MAIAHPEKTVLITGAATRIGRQIALTLAASGWDVAIHYNTSEREAAALAQEIAACGRKAVLVQGDVSDALTIDSIIDTAHQKLGSLGALINNAAIFTRDTIQNISSENFAAHMNINLRAPILLAQTFQKKLPKNERGAIINLLDGCDNFCLSPDFLSYTLSKDSLKRATLLMAESLAPSISVNGVCPGFTLPKSGEEEMFDRLVKKLPLQEATTPNDVANSVLFLLSTPIVTGQILSVNGGAHLL